MDNSEGDVEATQLVQRLMEMWERGDASQLDEIGRDDIIYEDIPNGQRFEGRKGVRRYIEHVHSWAEEVRIEITSIHGGADAAVAEWIMQGVHDRPIPGRIPVATNRRFRLKGATIVEAQEGRIVRAADYIDVLGFVLQLGGQVELPGGTSIRPE